MREPCNSISVASKRIEEKIEDEDKEEETRAASDVVERHTDSHSYLQTILKDCTGPQIKREGEKKGHDRESKKLSHHRELLISPID